MSHTWLPSATVVTPDHVWHGLAAVHGCCYKCNATAPSFHMASVWCRLNALLVYSRHLRPGQYSDNHLENFCISRLDIVLLQTLVLRYSKWFDLYIVQLNNIYWKNKTQGITSCWIAWTSILKSSLVILLTKKDPMTNQQKIILTIKSCRR